MRWDAGMAQWKERHASTRASKEGQGSPKAARPHFYHDQAPTLPGDTTGMTPSPAREPGTNMTMASLKHRCVKKDLLSCPCACRRAQARGTGG